MPWTLLAERFAHLPLILAGPMLRRVEPGSATVWLALREARMVTLRIYCKGEDGKLVEQIIGTRRTVRLGDYLHIVAVTAHAQKDLQLAWGSLYYYDVFFQSDDAEDHAPSTADHLETPGILNADPSSADLVHRLVYPEHPLPSFVLPPKDLNLLRILHGSCRKPHGTGKEMLAALDAVLETILNDEKKRPQHLFLTGDQIYADDVAAPLLFALTDAGDFLLSGNQIETLPIVDTPARSLPPGSRGSIVRNKAMFTTTTPKNQLLSLAEYVAMYLFVWSDILWPDELPEIKDIQKKYAFFNDDVVPGESPEQYADNLKKLRQFRATLPNVRRLLANIPLLTVCDDHDVTDDWYLDGAWCQQVLNSKLGHRIVRNALLAYALFQAWGNTPDQFEQPQGKAFLDTLNEWRGEESDHSAATIAEMLDVPDSFDGRGVLPHREHAFKWHYTYAGSRYQVIVMDTRTHRLYRTPSAFPGLLSPEALKIQLAHAIRKDVDVTVIISATPVIGQNFVESLQFWSHWSLRNNYALDREAWALDWDTFQPFLKTLAAMKRVVILSGDVHYAFGSSLDYWSRKERATAKIVDYTSSALLNEVSGPEIAVLTTIYPQLSRLIRGENPAQADFFAWDIDRFHHHVLKTILRIVMWRVYLIWWALPKLIDAHRASTEIVLPAQGWPSGAFNTIQPNRSYRVHYLRDQLDIAQPQKAAAEKTQTSHTMLLGCLLKLGRTILKVITIFEARVGKTRKSIGRRTIRITQEPTSHVRKHSAHGVIKGTDLMESRLEKRKNTLGEAIFHHQQWLQQWKAGSHIIGYANAGEIVFQWNNDQQEVIQRLWWWPPQNPDQPALASEFHETLKLPSPDDAPPLP